MKKSIVLIAFIFLFNMCTCDQGGSTNSPVIEVLDSHKITVKQFDDAYETAIESLSRTQNIEKKNLIDWISKDISEVPDQFKGLNQQFQKKNFYDNYRQMMMIKIVADKTNFTTRPDIKRILDQVTMQTISSLYIQEQVEKKLHITEKQIEAECGRLRKENAQFSAMDINRCMMIAKGFLKRRESEKIVPKVMERIKERISIKHNDKFDLDEYLKNAKGKKPAESPEKPKEETK
ncbi:MAG: lipoprotein LipL31 [Spirochaetota bacterium]